MSPFAQWLIGLNTTILLVAGGFLVKQSRRLDALYQAFVGLDGHGGMVDEIKTLRIRTHDLNNTMGALKLAVELLTKQMDTFDRRGQSP